MKLCAFFYAVRVCILRTVRTPLYSLILSTSGIILIGILFVFGFDVLIGKKIFFTNDISFSDIWHLNYPIKSFYKSELLQGRVALWCPFIGTGYPLLAEGEVGALYPINLLLFGTLPLPIAYNWNIFVHLIMGGCFAAVFAFLLGANQWGCRISGVVFAFCGFFLTHFKHPSMLATATWIPLLLVLIELLFKQIQFRFVVLLSLSCCCMILAGHSQIAYYNLFICGIYTTIKLMCLWNENRKQKNTIKNMTRLTVTIGCTFVVGCMLAAPQLSPTLELQGLSKRHGGLSIAEATHWQYKWKHLCTFILPFFFGDPGSLRSVEAIHPQTGQKIRDASTGQNAHYLKGFEQDAGSPILFWEMCAYIGIVPLVLALFGTIFYIKKTCVRIQMCILIISILLSLGKQGGLFYPLFYGFPFYNHFRFQSRFLLYADVAIALIAGIGFTALCIRFSFFHRAMIVSGAGCLVISVILIDQKLTLGDHNPTVETDQWIQPSKLVQTIIDREKNSIDQFRIIVHDRTSQFFMNAYYVARGWKHNLDAYKPTQLVVRENLNVFYRLANIDYFFPLAPRWMDLLQAYTILPDNHKIISLFNVKYIIDPFGTCLHKFPLLAEFDGGPRLRIPLDSKHPLSPFVVRLHENHIVLPRAFCVPHARYIRNTSDSHPNTSDLTDEFSLLLASDFNPKQEVIIHVPLNWNYPESTTSEVVPFDATTTTVSTHSQKMELSVNVTSDCWLFLSDTYYPGWKAFIDGKETSIFRANVVGRAIQVPKGSHKVLFIYAPHSFRVGCFVSMVGLLVLCSFGVWRVYKGHRNHYNIFSKFFKNLSE